MRCNLVAMLVVLALGAGAPRAQEAAVSDCGTWQECRDRALAAAAAEDYETFHDLSWRAVQRGPRNDPALMTMLARAQSLSGRPHDALVMLQRLADAGVVTDAAESEDFRRVRALPGWAAFAARTGRAAEEAEEPVASEAAGAPPVAARVEPAPLPGIPRMPMPAVPPGARKPLSPPPAAAPERPPSDVDPEPREARREGTAEPEVGEGAPAEMLRFSTLPFAAAGLVHDAVSSRFIIADRDERKLAVIGERAQRIATLAGPESAGFGEITALALDAREGDLWVASTTGESAAPRLHKLQLISGRALYDVELSSELAPARFVDLAVAPGGVVLALDAHRARIFRVRGKAREIELASSIDRPGLVSLAPASASAVYLAHATGIGRLDLASGTYREVSAGDDLPLGGFIWIRYFRGSLVGLQSAGERGFRMVRVRLDASGRRATTLALLDPAVTSAGAPAAALSGDALYYLSATPAPDFSGAVDTIVRRISLKP